MSICLYWYLTKSDLVQWILGVFGHMMTGYVRVETVNLLRCEGRGGRRLRGTIFFPSLSSLLFLSFSPPETWKNCPTQPPTPAPFSPQKMCRLNPYATRHHMSENSQYSLTCVTFSEIPIQVYRHDDVSIWQGLMKCNDIPRLAGKMQILYYKILKTYYTHIWFQNVVSCVSICLCLSIPVEIISLILSIRMYLYIHHPHPHPHIHTHTQKRISRDLNL